MTTFKVYGSHGVLVVDGTSGQVLDYIEDGDGEYANIRFFNVDEWRRTYTGQTPDHVDILTIGYWTGGGDYEPPEQEWRQLMMAEGG